MSEWVNPTSYENPNGFSDVPFAYDDDIDWACWKYTDTGCWTPYVYLLISPPIHCTKTRTYHGWAFGPAFARLGKRLGISIWNDDTQTWSTEHDTGVLIGTWHTWSFDKVKTSKVRLRSRNDEGGTRGTGVIEFDFFSVFQVRKSGFVLFQCPGTV